MKFCKYHKTHNNVSFYFNDCCSIRLFLTFRERFEPHCLNGILWLLHRWTQISSIRNVFAAALRACVKFKNLNIFSLTFCCCCSTRPMKRWPSNREVAEQDCRFLTVIRHLGYQTASDICLSMELLCVL